ncbi:hypothetical protein LTR53_009304 [Teratosphaeriaceae sp. CCFEE 6253]|nr:hypothetical protein LTR53_009304 [Teratosphaeriaceae sp. CCFEE 6253]
MALSYAPPSLEDDCAAFSPGPSGPVPGTVRAPGLNIIPSGNPFPGTSLPPDHDEDFRSGEEKGHGSYTPPVAPGLPFFPTETSPSLLNTQLTELFDAGKDSIFYTLCHSKARSVPETAVIDIAALQQMNLHHLQWKIAGYIGRSFDVSRLEPSFANAANGSVEDLSFWIEEYCTPLSDYNVQSSAEPRLHEGEGDWGTRTDPFKMHSSRAVERSIMETVSLIPHHVLPAGVLPHPEDGAWPQLIGSFRTRSEADAGDARKALWKWFRIPVTVGLLLTVSLLFMALATSSTMRLVVTVERYIGTT